MSKHVASVSGVARESNEFVLTERERERERDHYVDSITR